MKTHKQQYPEQYRHPLCGKQVRVKGDPNTTYTVERVVSTRFGPLAPVPGNEKIAYAIGNLEIVS